MSENGINKIKITNYEELRNLIHGKDVRINHDIREDFIFRGLSNVNYELIPSSLRKNNLNQLNINELIESEYKFKVAISEKEVKNNNLKFDSNHRDADKNIVISFNKYGKPILDINSKFKAPENKLQKEREYYILMKFLYYTDKCGLKINADENARNLLHTDLPVAFDGYIDQQSMIDVMSLAQHYGLPTRALDWSYDYKVSLYFAVKDALIKSKSNDGVLWALNYKLIENREFDDRNYRINLQIYRPEYNTNPNLNAQKGLFTYLNEYIEDYDKPLDKIISSELSKSILERPKDENYFGKLVTVPINLTSEDIIFYKFIIPKEIKPQILKELYLDGYSEEYLFPGYNGVTQSVINRIKLNNLLNETKILKKNILLNVDWDICKVKNKEKLYEFVECDFDCEINKIFIHQDNKVLGYFIGNEIIKDSSKNLWNKFGELSGLSESEFKDSELAAIRINDLHLFKYPIKLHDYKLANDFCYIEKDDESLNFLLNFKY